MEFDVITTPLNWLDDSSPLSADFVEARPVVSWYHWPTMGCCARNYGRNVLNYHSHANAKTY